MRGTPSARELAALGPAASGADVASLVGRTEIARECGVETSERIRRRSAAIRSHRPPTRLIASPRGPELRTA
jgi:hypothetical protein